MSDNYTPEQKAALKGVESAVRTLIELEELQKKACQPHIGLQGYMNASAADLQIDNYPPHYVLEERLRRQVTEAQKLGLRNDPLVKKCGKLSAA